MAEFETLSKACFWLEILQFTVAPIFGTFASIFEPQIIWTVFTQSGLLGLIRIMKVTGRQFIASRWLSDLLISNF